MKPTDTIFFDGKLSKEVYFDRKYPLEAWMRVGNNEFQCVWRKKESRVSYYYIDFVTLADRAVAFYLRKEIGETTDSYDITLVEIDKNGYHKGDRDTDDIKLPRDGIHDSFENLTIIKGSSYRTNAYQNYLRGFEVNYNQRQGGFIFGLDYREDKTVIKNNDKHLRFYVANYNGTYIGGFNYIVGAAVQHYYIPGGLFLVNGSGNRTALTELYISGDLQYLGSVSSPYGSTYGGLDIFITNVTGYLQSSNRVSYSAHILLAYYNSSDANPVIYFNLWQAAANVDIVAPVGAKSVVGQSNGKTLFLGKNSSDQIHMYELNPSGYSVTDRGSVAYNSFASDVLHFGFLRTDLNETTSEFVEIDSHGDPTGTVIQGSREIEDDLIYLWPEDTFGYRKFNEDKTECTICTTDNLQNISSDTEELPDESSMIKFFDIRLFAKYVFVFGESYFKEKLNIGMRDISDGSTEWLKAYDYTKFYNKLDTNIKGTYFNFTLRLDGYRFANSGNAIVFGPFWRPSDACFWIFYSTDGGSTWNTSSVSVSGTNVSSGGGILYGNGRFIFSFYYRPSGSSSYAYKTAYSTDNGATWSVANQTVGGSSSAVSILPYNCGFANGYFLCLYSSSKYYKSTNGVAWTSVSGSSLPTMFGYSDGSAFWSPKKSTAASTIIGIYSVSGSGGISLSSQFDATNFPDYSGYGPTYAGCWFPFNDLKICGFGYYIDEQASNEIRRQFGTGYFFSPYNAIERNKFAVFNDILFAIDSLGRVCYSKDGVEFNYLRLAYSDEKPNNAYGMAIYSTGEKLCVLSVNTTADSSGYNTTITKYELISTDDL